MAFLNIVSSLFGTVQMPSGLWEILIGRVFGFVTSYGWRIVLFTVLLKLLLFPLDLYQRKTMRDNAKKMERMKPQLEKLQEQFGHDKNAMSQKQMALYKQEKYSMFSSCIPMIVSMVIFFTMYAGFTNITHYMSMSTYYSLYEVYSEYNPPNSNEYQLPYTTDDLQTAIDKVRITVVNAEIDEKTYEDEFIENFKTYFFNNNGAQPTQKEITDAVADCFKALPEDLTTYYTAESGTFSPEQYHKYVAARAKQVYAQDMVVQAYDEEYKQSFLWVKSIWNSDVPWQSPIQDKDGFVGNTGLNRSALFGGKAGRKYQETFANEIEMYDDVMGGLVQKYNKTANGYLVLVILVAAFSFLTQFVSQKMQKGSQPAPGGMGGMGGSMGTTMKVMMFLMPILMGYFALSSGTAFTLYLMSNSLMTLLLMFGANWLLKMWDNHKEKKEMETVHVIRRGPVGASSDTKKGKKNDDVVVYRKKENKSERNQNSSTDKNNDKTKKK